tara:strand:+ start:854 stop:1054 length:201 start_codon:yes stop_codon:yes gene_type:complete
LKRIEHPVLALQPKDVEREKIAEDIRKYVNRGGTIKTIHHGETALNTRLTKVWAKKILHRAAPKKG